MGCFSSVSSWRHQLHSSFSWTKKKQNRSSSACNLFPGYDACLPLTSEEHSKFLYVVGMNGKTGSFKVYESKKCESVSRSVVTLCSIMNYSPPGFCVSVEFSRKHYWSGLPFPSSGDLSNPGIKPISPALQADSLPSESPGKHK